MQNKNPSCEVRWSADKEVKNLYVKNHNLWIKSEGKHTNKDVKNFWCKKSQACAVRWSAIKEVGNFTQEPALNKRV